MVRASYQLKWLHGYPAVRILLMAVFLFLALLSAEWCLHPEDFYLCSHILSQLWHKLSVMRRECSFCQYLVLYSMVGFRSRRVYIALGMAGTSALGGGFFSLRQVAGHASVDRHTPFELLPLGVYFMKYVNWMILPVRMSVERSTDVAAK